MGQLYFPTQLEIWVSEKYKMMKILKPEDISEDKIARI
jgi:hypothetical protein